MSLTIGQFWAIIEQARAGRGAKKPEAFLDALKKLLKNAEPADLVAFKRHLQMQLHRAYTWPLWGAAYIIHGGCSDDGFEYWRAWLVAQGRETFENAVRDPDWLATLNLPFDDDGSLEFESLLYLPLELYEAKVGSEMPDEAFPANPSGTEPTGPQWSEDDLESLRRLLPRLSAMYE